MADTVDSGSTGNSGETGKAPRRRTSTKTAGPKSATDHVSASGPVLDVVADAAPKAKRASKPKVEGEKPAKAPKAKAGKSAKAEGETVASQGSPFAVMFQAPDLPTVVPGTRTRGATRGPAADGDEGETSTAARRRTRRRSGESPREGEDAPNTVVRVRQPRRPAEQITEPQRVKGSTRLEAKKQRRRDGRDAGRRRPVITEAEFLARRESVDRVMVVRSKYGRIQIGVL
ncbi:MAG: ribonuclease E/G, partial [Leifsonia sp.]